MEIFNQRAGGAALHLDGPLRFVKLKTIKSSIFQTPSLLALQLAKSK